MLGETVEMVVAMQGHCKKDGVAKAKERGARRKGSGDSIVGGREAGASKLNEGCPGYLGSWREVTSQRGDRH